MLFLQWHGTGGSSRCEGTTKEDAILNTKSDDTPKKSESQAVRSEDVSLSSFS